MNLSPIGSRAELADHINTLVQLGPAAIGRVVLFSALYRGGLALWEVIAGGAVSATKRFVRAAIDRPAVILIGDDDGLDRGPAGFPGAAKALAWGRWFLIHASGAEREHYELAVGAAHMLRRVAVIECGTTTFPAWQALVAKAPNRVGGVIIWPRGGVHPVEAVQ